MVVLNQTHLAYSHLTSRGPCTNPAQVLAIVLSGALLKSMMMGIIWSETGETVDKLALWVKT